MQYLYATLAIYFGGLGFGLVVAYFQGLPITYDAEALKLFSWIAFSVCLGCFIFWSMIDAALGDDYYPDDSRMAKTMTGVLSAVTLILISVGPSPWENEYRVDVPWGEVTGRYISSINVDAKPAAIRAEIEQEKFEDWLIAREYAER